MKKVVLLLAALAATPAFAQNMYATGSVGRAEQKVTIEDYSSAKQSDTGFNAAVGYRITPTFSVEAGYAALGKASETDYDYGLTVTAKSNAIYGAVVGIYPMTPKVSLSAKVGLARNTIKFSVTDGYDTESVKTSKTDLTFGVGAAYTVTPQVAFVADYQYFGKSMDEDGVSVKTSLLSVGVRYSF